MPHTVRHPLRTLLLALLAIAAFDQLVHYSVLSDGWLFGQRIAPYDPPLFNESQVYAEEQFQLHARTGRPLQEEFQFDEELGWAPVAGITTGTMQHDWSGSRQGPQELAQTKSEDLQRLITIGAAFTLGTQVANDETWPYLVDAGSEDWELANLAVDDYGIDQALMRLRRDGLKLKPDEVWLGWQPATALRVCTLFVPAEEHATERTMFKPRFHIGADKKLVKFGNPAQSIAHAARLLERQGEFYDAVAHHDLWVTRAERTYRRQSSSLLHRTAFTRLLLTYRERKRRDPAEWLIDSASSIHRLTAQIILETERECRRTNARFRLIVLPTRADLEDRIERGSAYWASTVFELTDQGIEVIDLTDALVTAKAHESDEFWTPGGNYSPHAHRVVADLLKGYL